MVATFTNDLLWENSAFYSQRMINKTLSFYSFIAAVNF